MESSGREPAAKGKTYEVADTLVCRRVVLVDDEGKVRGTLGLVGGVPALEFLGEGNETRCSLRGDAGEVGAAGPALVLGGGGEGEPMLTVGFLGATAFINFGVGGRAAADFSFSEDGTVRSALYDGANRARVSTEVRADGTVRFVAGDRVVTIPAAEPEEEGEDG